MKAVLGYLNQSEWLYLLNIGNIMQINPMTVHDIYTNNTYEVELTRDSILEKVSTFILIYFEERLVFLLYPTSVFQLNCVFLFRLVRSKIKYQMVEILLMRN